MSAVGVSTVQHGTQGRATTSTTTITKPSNPPQRIVCPFTPLLFLCFLFLLFTVQHGTQGDTTSTTATTITKPPEPTCKPPQRIVRPVPFSRQ